MAGFDPGVPVALSQLVRRIVAPNPGLMTGPGTNTYLVGVDEVAVIDPGPDDDAHVDAIVAAAGKDRVRWIVLTHTHPDHWPATARLQRATGARLAAFPRPPKADAFDLRPDRLLRDGDVVEGTEFGLTVLHTPGHAPNHVCLFLDEERSLFTGDHVLDGTTTVVSPDRGGDMAAYLASLERLKRIRRLRRILPAHGDVITEPTAKLDDYLRHRRLRERQILKILGARGPLRIADLVSEIYADTPQGRPGGLPEGLVDMARRQLHAHLLKLRAEGRVAGTAVNRVWARVEPDR
jgi:glyoxylase-like metal-dependent hydrolase (beta-lactamase superfamily II)